MLPVRCFCVTKMNFLFLCFVGLLQKSDTASLTSYLTNHTRRHIYINCANSGGILPRGVKTAPLSQLDRSVNGCLLPESKSMREHTHTHTHKMLLLILGSSTCNYGALYTCHNLVHLQQHSAPVQCLSPEHTTVGT